jgi:hypothetical protein
LSIKALELLEGENEEIENLKKDWCTFEEKLEQGAKAEPWGKITLMADRAAATAHCSSAKRLIEEGETVLKILLLTPLNALCDEGNKLRSIKDVFYRQPDYEEINNIQQSLQEDGNIQNHPGLSIASLLAAAENAFEAAVISAFEGENNKRSENLSDLSDRLLEILNCRS